MNQPLFNHLTLRSGKEIIIHTGSPSFIAEIIKGDEIDIKILHYIDKPTPEEIRRLPKLLSRTGDWYFYTIVKNNNNG